jgi:hypothetical protein
MKRFFHWLGHALFDMDCAVYVLPDTNRMYCKKCGRDVSDMIRLRSRP